MVYNRSTIKMRRTFGFLSVLVFSIFSLGAKSNAENCSNYFDEPTQFTQEVCKFSIDTPSGTMTKGGQYTAPETMNHKVLLSCPQEREVNVTVSLVIDGEVVSNKIVTIKKGEKESSSFKFSVASEYASKKYKLTVE